jgi:alpha-L-fucosidase
MNIGPKGDGTFDQKDKNILDSIGGWLSANGFAIYGTERGSLPIPAWGVSTQKGQHIYLHVFNWPKDGNLLVGGLKSDVKSAYFLADKSKKKLTVKRLDASNISLNVPVNSPGSPDVVIVLEINGKIETDKARVLDPDVSENRFLVFDASQHGEKLGFGDGKTNRYYVTGWKSKDSYLSWDLKALKSARYKIVAKYIADDAGSSYEVSIGSFSKKNDVIPSSKGAVVSQEIGVAMLDADVYQLTVKPIGIKGAELMKLLEVQLIPLK